MKLAVLGILADRVGSGAGAFPVLLRALLERGVDVDVFGMRGFNDPRSLEGIRGYRFFDVHVPFFERLHRTASKVPSPYPVAAVAQVAHVAYQREAVRRIEAEDGATKYSLVLCTDAQALSPSRLPLACWPQSPPQTEAAALRNRAVASAAVQAHGVARYAAVQAFYVYRQLVARAALGWSDLYLCGSRWAHDEWARFGAAPEQLRVIAYPIDLAKYAAVPAAGASGESTTFLWLGRAVARKRLDLFLQGFVRLHERVPAVRAVLVGNLRDDPAAQRWLGAYQRHPAISVEPPCRHDQVPQLFGRVDVLVQPSQNENFGFSVAEALAAGRAVVLGPTNGTADYVGAAGFVFRGYDPDSVALAMGEARTAVLRDGAGVSAAARAAALHHFALGSVVDRFLSCAADTVTNHARRKRT